MRFTAHTPFAAVLLAGGRSTRMGFDKAAIRIDGQALWERQLTTLRALHPHELFISGRDGDYRDSGVEIVEDAIPGLGPLGGIAAALRRAQSPLVLVLAIDLPRMTAGFLATLVRDGIATIPGHADFLEPLAASYPTSALPIAEEMLRAGDKSMRQFALRVITSGQAMNRAITDAERAQFRNLNRPADLNEASPEE